MSSVFMGWFAKPQYRVVLHAPKFQDQYVEIRELVLEFDTVMMVFYQPLAIVSDRFVVWSNPEKFKVVDGLQHSNLFITDVCKPEYQNISHELHEFTTLNNLKLFLTARLQYV